MSTAKNRVSERRAEHLLSEILESQGWRLQRPPKGDVLLQQEYRAYPNLYDALRNASKTGKAHGLPEAILVDATSIEPLAVIEAKAKMADIDQAIEEAEGYANHCLDEGFSPLAIGIAGEEEDAFELRVHKWTGRIWEAVTYDGSPIGWIPTPEDLSRIVQPDGPTEIRPTIPPAEVLANRADEINRLLRESNIQDAQRPAVVGATMLALWQSEGNIRKDREHILVDINQACEKAFIGAGKQHLSRSLLIDEANEKLAVKTRRIVSILERLNVTVLTAEHDYLGQLYETFFRYTGGNTIGQYFTPRHIAEFMAELCQVGPDDVVLDPACGSGGFLIASMSRILKTTDLSREQLVEMVKTRLLGFEVEPVTAALCVANMILRGDGSSGVHQGDCFTAAEYPVGEANIALMNPPFPHKKTDIPPEDFVDRALEGLETRGKLAVVLPTSLLAKGVKGAWREKVLKRNSLLTVCQMPDEIFQPYASATTSVVVIEKGVPHATERKTTFIRVQNDGLTLKKGTRVERPDGGAQLGEAVDASLNHRITSGFSGTATVAAGDEWSVGAYIPSVEPDRQEVLDGIDVLLRRMGSFYTRYAKEIVRLRSGVRAGELAREPYRDLLSDRRLSNAQALPANPGTIGGMFDIFYGLKELHSREGMAPGHSLVISPTEEYNGCYGWLEFQPLLKPPFVTVAQTGSIGEAFIQNEPCAPNDDCLVLLPKPGLNLELAHLVIAAGTLHTERWRFTYGRKLTPQRICDFPVLHDDELIAWTKKKLKDLQRVIRAALKPYEASS